METILERISRIEKIVEAGRDVFDETIELQDALERNLEIIAGSTQKLSASLKSARSEIQWREIAGLRNRLAHDYLGTEVDLIWRIAEQDVPALKKSMREALAELE